MIFNIDFLISERREILRIYNLYHFMNRRNKLNRIDCDNCFNVYYFKDLKKRLRIWSKFSVERVTKVSVIHHHEKCIKHHLILQGFLFVTKSSISQMNSNTSILWLDYCEGSRWFYDLHGVSNHGSVSFWQFTLWQPLYDKSMNSL